METVDDLRPGPGGSRAPSSVDVKKGATWNKGATWIQRSMFRCERGTSSAKSCTPPIIEAQLIGENITGIPPNMLQLNREHWLDSRDSTKTRPRAFSSSLATQLERGRGNNPTFAAGICRKFRLGYMNLLKMGDHAGVKDISTQYFKSAKIMNLNIR